MTGFSAPGLAIGSIAIDSDRRGDSPDTRAFSLSAILLIWFWSSRNCFKENGRDRESCIGENRMDEFGTETQKRATTWEILQ